MNNIRMIHCIRCSFLSKSKLAQHFTCALQEKLLDDNLPTGGHVINGQFSQVNPSF